MAHKSRPELCNQADIRSRYAIRRPSDLGKARSFHPAPCNQADIRSTSVRNRSGSPVVGNRNPAVGNRIHSSRAGAANNTAPWRARMCQAQLRQCSQQPRVFSLYALCRPPYFLFCGRHSRSLSWPSAMPTRRFPPPWSVEQQDACFVVKDSA